MSRWATVCVGANESPVDALERWYYGEPSDDPADAPGCDFRAYVHCCELPDLNTRVMRLDMCAQDPYSRCLYIFYVRDGSLLYVLGALSFRVLEQLGGVVDMLTAPLERSRYIQPLWEPPLTNAASDGVELFYLPMVLPAEAGGAVPWERIERRALAYLEEDHGGGGGEACAEHELGCALGTGAVCAAIGRLYSIPGTTHDMHVHKERFAQARYAWERARLFRRWDQLLLIGGQRAVRAILDYSGITTSSCNAVVVAPHPLDRQAFLRRCAWRGEPPAWVLRVRVEDVPKTLSTVLPLHAGGFVHLAYCDVVQWAWHRFQVQDARERSSSSSSCLDDDERLVHIARLVVRRQQQPRPRRPWVALSAGASGGGVEPAPVIAVREGVALDALVPPCFAAVMGAPQFPRHLQRIRLVPTLLAAGVAPDAVAEWFERKHAAFPNDARSARARFDYAAEGLARLGPTYCGNIVKDGVHFRCPYGGDRSTCAAGTRPFSGPEHFIRRKLHEHQRPPPPPQAPAEDESSSGGSEEEEPEEVW